jgi:hypothetical protein
MGLVWRHFKEDGHLSVGPLVFLYALVVRTHRLWLQITERPYYGEENIPELSARIDSHTSF